MTTAQVSTGAPVSGNVYTIVHNIGLPPQPRTTDTAFSGSTGSSARKKICLDIFDKFSAIELAGYERLVHFIYQQNITPKLYHYAELIKTVFPRAGLSIRLYEYGTYVSTLITIYPNFRYKHTNKKYLQLLDKTARSPHYSSLIDLDYSMANG